MEITPLRPSYLYTIYLADGAAYTVRACSYVNSETSYLFLNITVEEQPKAIAKGLLPRAVILEVEADTVIMVKRNDCQLKKVK